MVECVQCQLLRLFPCPSPSELEVFYPDNYWFAPQTGRGKLTELYRRIVLTDHLRFARRALASTQAEGFVLDVGCGGGLFLRMLGAGGVRVLGLDVSLQAARIAWQTNHVPAVCANLMHAPIADSSCAMVTMFHVLEHLHDPASYLDEARRLLQPDGRLIVQTPNAASWQFLLFGENWNGVDIPRHLIHFRARDLRLLLEDCGFELVREKYFSLRDNPAGLAMSLAPGLDPMVRRVRNLKERPLIALLKDIAYLALVAAAIPASLLEAACRQGSTIMIEARKRP